jgi:uncharacterized glyoxalase superfamily protein PhnB
MDERPVFNQLNVIVRDMAATVAFYRRAGLEFAAEADARHVELKLPNGFLIEFDSADSIGTWDTGWNGTTGAGVVIGFALSSRDAVDALFGALTGDGHRARQPPYDAFWGARYAIVEDPDGNGVGLMSPIESERRFWPPQPPPHA